MSHITELKSRLARLQRLVDDPHPGIGEWRRAFGIAAENLLRFFDHSPDCIGYPNPPALDALVEAEKNYGSGIPGDDL